MHTFGVLSSGVPNTFRHIHSAIQSAALPNAKIGLVLCDKPGTPILAAAAELHVPCEYILEKKDAFDAKARDVFARAGVETVLLIGYERKVGTPLLKAYPDRIFNIHGGPLPRFGGKGMIHEQTQKAVVAAGVKYTGPTVHIVDEQYDHGQVLAHWPVKIRRDDTSESLNARCNLAGRRLYVAVLRDFLYRLEHPEWFE
jgi:phosphoribosylglycinamide formyltransferase-1